MNQIERIKAERDRVLQWIISQGAVICTDASIVERAKRCFTAVLRVFPEIESKLSALYVYRQSEQPEELKNADAITWDDVLTNENRTLHAIGISVEALDKGEDYAALCIMHELNHVTNGGQHDISFHTSLEELIKRYNAVTGSHVVNDNYGLPMRFDNREYNPLETAVFQGERAQGAFFRTEEAERH